MSWFLWAVLLLAQQASHTFSSRAKNSNSLLYNTLAAIASNGIWFCSNFIILDVGLRALRTQDWLYAAKAGVFYTTFCVLGSVGAQWIAMRLERRYKYATY